MDRPVEKQPPLPGVNICPAPGRMLLLLLMAALGLPGCEKDDLLRYPIPGKWQLIAEGHTQEEVQPVTPTDAYIEYFSNGKMATYGPHDGAWYYKMYTDRVYKMDDTYLYIEFNRKIYGTGSDRTYKYFYDASTEQLTLKHFKGIVEDIPNFPFIKVYKRIN
jgi:hypothetical protein